MNQTIYEISFKIQPEWVDWVQELCADLNPIINYELQDPTHCLIQVFTTSEPLLKEQLNILHQRLIPHLLDSSEIHIQLKTPDWQNTWKQFFKPIIIEDKLLINPSWIPVPTDKIYPYTIQIDPGMAFGTGQHFTTQYCLKRLLHLDSPKEYLIDLGTGSGILSILAAQIGFSDITAIDIDSIAVETAKKMADQNHTLNKITFCIQDIASIGLDKKYNVVLANLLTPILIQFSKKIFSLLEKNSYLVMSGIWQKEQTEAVIQEYQKYSLELIHQDSNDGWHGITFRRLTD